VPRANLEVLKNRKIRAKIKQGIVIKYYSYHVGSKYVNVDSIHPAVCYDIHKYYTIYIV
jgi:hypothetical protein